MKVLNYVSGRLILLAIACRFAASTPIQARTAKSNSASAGSGDIARLIVTRPANSGTFLYLNLLVDGFQVADLAVNQSYDAVFAYLGIAYLIVRPSPAGLCRIHLMDESRRHRRHPICNLLSVPATTTLLPKRLKSSNGEPFRCFSFYTLALASR